MSFVATSMLEATRILSQLADELAKRAKEWEIFDSYYRGLHKLKFASSEFSTYFAHRYKGFADNWTQVIADAPTERLEVIGIRPYGGRRKGGDAALWRDWMTNEADHYSDLAWLDAIIGRRAFTLVWGDEKTQEPVLTWENPSQAIVDYEPGTGRRRSGAKVWRDEAKEYATLYLPDGVYKFERVGVTTNGRTDSGLYVSSGIAGFGGWTAREVDGEPWPLSNPFGVVPLVEHQNRARLLGAPMSDIHGAVSMQDAINLLWAYLFNAADFASFPQRVVMNAEKPVVPVLNSDGEVIGERPVDLEKFAVDRVVWLEDKEAKIGEWSAANLDAYTEVMETAVGHLAAQSRTPAHYLLIGKGPSNVSGDALKGLETGLAMRAREKTQHFGRSTREVFRLIALARDDKKKAAAVAAGEVLWRDVENRSEAQHVDALAKRKDIGYPFEWLLEKDGLSPTEIKRVLAMRKRELEQDPLSMLQPGREARDGADQVLVDAE